MAQMLTCFFDRWGIVNDEELQAKEIEYREMVYDLAKSIVNFFDELEELQDFGAAAQNDYSDIQLIKFSLQIIEITGELEHDIRWRNIMLREDKMWTNLKDNFEYAHQSLRTTRGKTLRSMAFQHANILAIQVLAEVKALKKDVL